MPIAQVRNLQFHGPKLELFLHLINAGCSSHSCLRDYNLLSEKKLCTQDVRGMVLRPEGFPMVKLFNTQIHRMFQRKLNNSIQQDSSLPSGSTLKRFQEVYKTDQIH